MPNLENHSEPHRTAICTPITRVAARLQEILGQRAVAYAIGVKSPKLIGRYASGEVTPQPHREVRLRELYYATLYFIGLGDQTIRAWFQAANPDLGFVTPLDMVREGGAVVVYHAAMAFGDQEGEA